MDLPQGTGQAATAQAVHLYEGDSGPGRGRQRPPLGSEFRTSTGKRTDSAGPKVSTPHQGAISSFGLTATLKGDRCLPWTGRSLSPSGISSPAVWATSNIGSPPLDNSVRQGSLPGPSGGKGEGLFGGRGHRTQLLRPRRRQRGTSGVLSPNSPHGLRDNNY